MDGNTQRIQPYEGTSPYIFISYSHRDYDRVEPILREMAAKGYRFWYDEGIDPGTEWPESIARHLENSSVCLSFMSANSAASKNCRREINFALSRNIALLTVFLEETQISSGLEMQISTYQSIMGYKYPDLPSLVARLESVDVTAPCRGTGEVATTAGGSGEHTASAAPKKRRIWFIAAAALVLAIIAVAVFWPKERAVQMDTATPSPEPDTKTAAPITPTPTDPPDDRILSRIEEYQQTSSDWTDHLWDQIPIAPNDPLPEGYRVLLYGEWGYGSLLMLGNDEGSIRFSLTDDRIPDGFPISPNPGKCDPYWNVILSLSNVDFLHLNIEAYERPASFAELHTSMVLFSGAKESYYDGFLYSLEDNTLIFEIQLPEQFTTDDIQKAGINLGTELNGYVDSYEFFTK